MKARTDKMDLHLTSPQAVVEAIDALNEYTSEANEAYAVTLNAFIQITKDTKMGNKLIENLVKRLEVLYNRKIERLKPFTKPQYSNPDEES